MLGSEYGKNEVIEAVQAKIGPENYSLLKKLPLSARKIIAKDLTFDRMAELKLTVGQAARAVGLPTRELLAGVNLGRITSTFDGRHRTFSPDDLINYLLEGARNQTDLDTRVDKRTRTLVGKLLIAKFLPRFYEPPNRSTQPPFWTSFYTSFENLHRHDAREVFTHQMSDRPYSIFYDVEGLSARLVAKRPTTDDFGAKVIDGIGISVPRLIKSWDRSWPRIQFVRQYFGAKPREISTDSPVTVTKIEAFFEALEDADPFTKQVGQRVVATRR